MDSLDVKIFLAMEAHQYIIQGGMERQLNLRSMAKQLGVDPDTVRARIKKLESNFIKYYQVFPNFRVFGLRLFAFGLVFSDPAAKGEALQKLKLMEEVGWIDERLNSLRVHLLYRGGEPDLEKELALIEKLTGAKPIRQNYMDMRPVETGLSLTDWLIIKSIRYDARKPTEEVAREVGLTTRAVNYRIQRLRRGKAFFIVPVVSFDSFQNAVCSHFTFFLDGKRRSEAIDEIIRLVGERTMSRLVTSEGSVSFCVPTRSIIESEEDYLKVKVIPGVEKVIMDFPLRCHDTSAYIDKLIDEKIVSLESKS